MTSSYRVSYVKRNIFRRTIYPPSFVVVASIILEKLRGAESVHPPSPHSPIGKDQKSPVWIGLIQALTITVVWNEYFVRCCPFTDQATSTYTTISQRWVGILIILTLTCGSRNTIILSSVFYTGRVRPEVQTLTILYTIFDWKGNSFIYLP